MKAEIKPIPKKPYEENTKKKELASSVLVIQLPG